MVRLRQQLVGAADAVKGFFGAKKEQDSAVEKLEALRVRIDCLLQNFARFAVTTCLAHHSEHMQSKKLRKW